MAKEAKTLSGFECPEKAVTEIAERRLQELEDNGFCIKWGWDQHGPHDATLKYHHFLDHLYRIVKPNGEKIYVAEPYGLTRDDLREILAISEDKWHVWIGQNALWYPTRTTPICFEKTSNTESTYE